MQDVIVNVRLSFAVESHVTQAQMERYVRQAIENKLNEELEAHDHGEPLPEIAYNGDPVEAVTMEYAR